MNYPEMLATLEIPFAGPPPGWLCDEVEPNVHHTYYGPEYDDPRLVFEDTSCAICHRGIGPGLGPDGDYGQPTSSWITPWDFMGKLICEDCCEDIDPYIPNTQGAL